jgi:tRNA U34 5-carboxymethylaminomethyl modifying GTPase MnmE/TrmE
MNGAHGGLAARELTPRGAGAVSVVELVGPGARERLERLCACALAVGDVRLVRPRAPGGSAARSAAKSAAKSAGGAPDAALEDVLDESLAVVLGEERVELHLHGGPAVVSALLALFEPRRTGPASLEERAAERLARAPCEDAARILLDQAEGALRRELERLVGLAEPAARALAAELAERGRVARFALEPARVLLAGPANSGKSTLFNALVGERRALVAAEPGTTRDLVRAVALLGAWPVEWVDTAGERALSGAAEGHARVEAEGQRRARAERGRADLVLWLTACGAEPVPAPAGALALRTQADRVSDPPPGALSALCEPEAARAQVGALLRAALGLPEQAWAPGAGVPFEPGQRAALARAAAGGERAAEVGRALLAPA